MAFLWSTASVMVFTLLPTFLTQELGASKTQVGLIEGVAIFLAFLAKVFAGVLSDFWNKRKPLIVIGAIMSLMVKSIFALATSIWLVFIARSLDRLSKGVRSAPTDALIADLSPTRKEGGSYGVRQALYSLGTVVGSALAALLMMLFANEYRLVFWLSLLPALGAFALLIFYVKESSTTRRIYNETPWHWRDVQKLPPAFWRLLIITAFLMLARFSEAFLNLRAKELGWEVAHLPLLLVAYDLIAAMVAIPIGRLADQQNRLKLLLGGIAVLVITNIGIIAWPSRWGILLGMLMAGLHMGMTQGLIASMIAESTLKHLRGTAFALYYLTSGTAVLIGNTVAGHMADAYGTQGAFYGGLLFASLSILYGLRVHFKAHKTTP